MPYTPEELKYSALYQEITTRDERAYRQNYEKVVAEWITKTFPLGSGDDPGYQINTQTSLKGDDGRIQLYSEIVGDLDVNEAPRSQDFHQFAYIKKSKPKYRGGDEMNLIISRQFEEF